MPAEGGSFFDVAGPICEKCGGEMKLKTARKGRSAGGQFYGCVNYPTCDGTASVSSNDFGEVITGEDGSSFRDAIREVVVAPRHVGLQAKIFQSIALPSSYVSEAHESDIDRSVIRSFAQWRLDYPLPRSVGRNAAYRSALSVAESLMNRGLLPLCTVEMESALEAAGYRYSTNQLREEILDAANSPTIPFEQAEFDSEAERAFLRWLETSTVFQRRGWSITPQVNLRSLAFPFETSSRERVDFVLTHPTGDAIVVEVDGQQHEHHVAGDNARDKSLANVGIEVFRVPVLELSNRAGAALDQISARVRQKPELAHARTMSHLRLAKFASQLQCALLEALRGGWLDIDGDWVIGVCPPSRLTEKFRTVVAGVAASAVNELRALINNLRKLHQFHVSEGKTRIEIISDQATGVDVLVIPATSEGDRIRSAPGIARFLISDVHLSIEAAAPITACPPLRLQHPQREQAEWFLNYLFRKKTFWEGQWETIERSLQGKDTVVLLPTGRGKSIAYQLSALLLPGRCIVVAPILSLIDDQVDNLRRVGIDRCIGITSQVKDGAERSRIMEAFAAGQYLFCFVAPERFQTGPFRDVLRTLTTAISVSLIAIDEAHCVSEWGHDFRTAYLNLGRVAREYCESSGLIPPVVALTGTASRLVLKDVQRELGISDYEALITPTSFDRPELRFVVHRARSEEKKRKVEGILSSLPTEFGLDRSTFFRSRGIETHAGLVFCPHVKGSYGVVDQARELTRLIGAPVEFYSGTSPNAADAPSWDQAKRSVARRFKRNSTTVMACTKAFGMGIDKPNIRFTIHTGLPQSIESFYQEAGRAGRDRGNAICSIIISNDDPARTSKLLDPKTELSVVADIVNSAAFGESDDVVRALWFHVKSFQGVEPEMTDAMEVIGRIGDVGVRQLVNVSWKDYLPKLDDAKTRLEKALHRLVILGAVDDYTVNYGSKEFGVRVSGADRSSVAANLGKFVGGYQRALSTRYRKMLADFQAPGHQEFVEFSLRALGDFVYETIERARRRSLLEMLNASSHGDGEALRLRILAYLQTSEFDELLDRVINDSQVGGLDRIESLLELIVSPTEAAALRGAVARYLTAYPDVPGLLVIRAVTEALAKDCDEDTVRQNAEAAVGFSLGDYAIPEQVAATAFANAADCVSEKVGMSSLIIRSFLRSPAMNRGTVREMLRRVPANVVHLPAASLTIGLSEHTGAMLLSGGDQNG
jgi:ATP-dependent DNA helicase RecQ